ncbi:hypothetical protein FJY69_08410 [candidate division WOR-3 bacterium]|nr:hypothetical protein [candidate division WOR-3 bacterium]
MSTSSVTRRACVTSPAPDMIQQELSFDTEPKRLDPRLWHGSFNGKESTLQQLSPYVGKLKSGMVQTLLHLYSQEGDWVLDPFCGSGVVPLEALLHGRRAIGNDLSPYAYHLTLGKLAVPRSESEALTRATAAMDAAETRAKELRSSDFPDYIRAFFDPDTLLETAAAFEVLASRNEHFLLACLMGILHHVRPGFLSYPASHLTPYLREKKYPRAEYASMYAYRPVRPRLIAKVRRAFRRTMVAKPWCSTDYQVLCENSMDLSLPDESVDLVLSSPPYFGALDYARDNRLRLWFLGSKDWKALDRSLTARDEVYIPQMTECLKEMERVLKPGRHCVLVLGDVERDGKSRRTAELIGELAESVTESRLRVLQLVRDEIPDIRRSRRRTRTTKVEKLLVLRKRADSIHTVDREPLAVADAPARRRRSR